MSHWSKIGQLVRKLFYKKSSYDCIFAIGAHCPTADLLKSAGLRSFSGPFDWVAGLDMEGRFEIFVNEFADYFNKEDLRLIDNKKDKRMAVYKNVRTGLVFPHDFRSDVDFETAYKLVKEK
jgi:hypothetical protein